MEQMELMGKSSSKANEYKLAKKLMLIVFTDFLCWVSSKYCNPVNIVIQFNSKAIQIIAVFDALALLGCFHFPHKR